MTDAFRRDGTGWKLVASHTSVVTADPPAQSVNKSHWRDLAGDYQLLPDGWVFHVELRNGVLYGGRSPGNLRPLIPLTPVAFVLEGAWVSSCSTPVAVGARAGSSSFASSSRSSGPG